MDNMESLYQGFEKYFNDNQEKINYFLDVLKNVKEDRWQHSFNSDCSIDELVMEHFIYKTETINYDNINIVHNTKIALLGGFVDYEAIVVEVDDNIIFQCEDINNELFIEILDFIERAKKRTKGE